MHAPLKNITVLDLTNVLAGPFCCHQLAHLGANVIKIEVPQRGDLARQLGASEKLNGKNMGISFLAQNAGKKSLTLNLKTKEGVNILKRLVAKCDVLVENFRPGVMARLGVPYEVLKHSNASLIYCAISGFGQEGDLSARPAYDQIIQGLSGIMSITGNAQTGATRVGYPIADTVGGLTAAMAISAALNNKPRGTFIDVSMLEATIATMGWAVSNYLIGGVIPQLNGNENTTSAPSGTFATKNGSINIAANKDSQWQTLAASLNLKHCLSDERFSTRELRKKNRFHLKKILEEKLKLKTSHHWEKTLNAKGVPAGAVLNVPEALNYMKARKQIASYNALDNKSEPIELIKTGMRFNKKVLSVKQPPPKLGSHTKEILTSIGISLQDQRILRKKGIV